MTDKQLELLLQQGPLVFLSTLVIGTICYISIKHAPALVVEIQKAIAAFGSMATTFAKLTQLVDNMDGVLKEFGHTLDKVVQLTEKKFEAIETQLNEVKDLVSK